MKKLSVLTFVLAILMFMCFVFTACRTNDLAESTAITDITSSQTGIIKDDEYHVPLEDGYNQLTLYWTYDGEYDNCDVWIWWSDKAGQGYTFHECDYGAKAVVNVPEGIEQVGFIVRKDCSEPGGSSWGSAVKDFEQDRFAVLDGRETVIYLKSGIADQFTSNDGGKTLEKIKKFSLAGMVDESKIKYSLTPAVKISDITDVKLYKDEEEVEIKDISTIGKESLSGYIETEESLDICGNYRLEINGYGAKPVIPTDIFDSEYFALNYHYDGDDLGAVVQGENTVFKLWAPTASKVTLNLFENGEGGDAYKIAEMIKGDKGVWSHIENCGHGTYYTYTVTTAVGTQEAVDPYVKSAGVNGKRGMVTDLSKTDPDGWEKTFYDPPISSYSDAIIWEVHVRDFSNKISSSQYKGKYLAFTETGLVNEHGKPVGVDYLKDLGITHVHLLPVYDYASVDEKNPDGQFNWGYDPENYNVPEGSYSTDPYNGEVRVKEFKQMVMALHEAGIGVIMDVVYNHTYDANSSFNKIVPYYYYRYTGTGENTSASGCGNDTASERYMYGKFMVESTSYWIKEYKLDGFRFDLMGLHDLKTMQNIESAVHTVNPKAVIYGEGWTMGATIDGSAQANQSEISGIIPTGDAIGGIAVFNDAMRDGLKGSVFDKASQGYINGDASAPNLSKVIFGINGGKGSGAGWNVENSMVINYMSAHDNNTLWDKLMLSTPDSTDEQRNKMNNLGAALIMVSKGTPFWQAGEEMLRTKNGDENSYKSDDGINNIDWSVLKDGSREYETMLYYKGLIEMRKAYDIFSDADTEISYEQFGNGIAAVKFDDGSGGCAFVLINPHKTSLPYTLEGQWNLVADGTNAGTDVISRDSGSVILDTISVRIYVNDVLLKK